MTRFVLVRLTDSVYHDRHETEDRDEHRRLVSESLREGFVSVAVYRLGSNPHMTVMDTFPSHTPMTEEGHANMMAELIAKTGEDAHGTSV